MAFSEPYSVTEQRRRKAAEDFPVLGDGTQAGPVLQADDWGVPQGKPISDFSQTAMNVAAQAAQDTNRSFEQDQVDQAASGFGRGPVSPSWTQVASGQQSYDEGYQPPSPATPLPTPEPGRFERAIVGAPAGALERAGRIESYLPLPDEKLPIFGLPTQQQAGRFLDQNLPGPVREGLNLLPQFAVGGEGMGAVRGLGAVAGAVALPMAGEALLPADAPDWLRQAVRVGGNVGGALLGERLAPGAVRGAALIDQAFNPANLPKAEFGQGLGEDLINQHASIQSYFPEAPGMTHIEDLSSARAVDDFLTSRGVDIGGMLEKDKRALAGDLFQSERGAGPAIQGTGGAEQAPEDFFAQMQAKKAAGGTLSEDEQTRLMQMLGERLGAIAPENVPAAREAYYNAPENLGGGEALTPEQQANLDTTVRMAGGRNTITNALENARAAEAAPESSAIESVIARNADELPEPTRTVPQNLAEIQARARVRAQQPPTAGGAPGGEEPFLRPGEQPAEPFPSLEAVSQSVGMPETVPATKTEQAMDLLNAPRTILTSFDLSAPFRQGAMLIGHPREFFGNLKPMVQAFASDTTAQQVEDAIRNSPLAGVKDEAGLYIAPLDFKPGTGITQREEAYMSQLVGRIPGVNASQRAYVTFLNKLRSDTFDHFWQNLPAEAQTPANAERYAKFINAATGRGSLPNALADYAPALNAAFFSPRYFASRLQANGLGAQALADLAKSGATRQALDPVSKQIAGDWLKFYATGAATLGAAKAAGAGVELDPRSSDFGKIKVGDTRYDVWAGNQQIARFIAQELSGQRKATTTGAVAPAARGQTVINFVRGKLAPIPGLITDTLTGKTLTGEKVDTSPSSIRDTLYRELTPMIIQDIADGAKDAGVVGGIRSLPTVLGVGMQTYAPTNGRPARPQRPARPVRPSRGG